MTSPPPSPVWPATLSPAQRLHAFKQQLRQQRDALDERFRAGESVDLLVREQAKLMDSLLIATWPLWLAEAQDACLAAVGGYGRGELHPHSDIDILILTNPESLRRYGPALEQFLTFLWDLGLQVGQSVRTIEDCVREAGKDLTVITNLLEARWLTGHRGLFLDMQAAIQTGRMWPCEPFFFAKLDEQRKRYAKFDDTANNLEPDIKESPGGLRDLQIIGWVAQRYFGVGSFEELLQHGFLTPKEFAALQDDQIYLWRLRYALHLLAGRREDRLLFDHQPKLAEQFGFESDNANLAVERMMQGYYRVAEDVRRHNELLLQLFDEAIVRQGAPLQPQPLNRRFQIINGCIGVTDPLVFQRTPLALLEIFHLMQTHPEITGIRADTIRAILDHCHRIDETFRGELASRSLFMEIIRHPTGLTHVLRRMNRYGILAAYLPAFANISGRMQYDLFHVYTVDIHTLFVVRNLRRIQLAKFQGDIPLLTKLIREVPKIELLFLAALFHDIAKGRGGDHSKLGAHDAYAFCRLHALSEFDSNLVAWLVKNHLLLSITAQRRDISDPEEVQQFAAKIGDTMRLNYLYLLTVADSQATNPNHWNSWRASLLGDWYQYAHDALVRGLDNPKQQDEYLQEKREEALSLLAQQGLDKASVLNLWLSFHLEFFLHNAPRDIAWYTSFLLKNQQAALPLIATRTLEPRGGTEIFLYTSDEPGLFAITTALLDQMGLNILDAWLMTTDPGMALCTYVVMGLHGEELDAGNRIEMVRILKQRLPELTIDQLKVSRRRSRQHRHFNCPTSIALLPDPQRHRTQMNLITADRPGLLAEVGRVFAAHDVRIQKAQISTIGAEVEDIFFLSDIHHQAIEEPEQLQALHQALSTRLADFGDCQGQG